MYKKKFLVSNNKNVNRKSKNISNTTACCSEPEIGRFETYQVMGTETALVIRTFLFVLLLLLFTADPTPVVTAVAAVVATAVATAVSTGVALILLLLLLLLLILLLLLFDV